jgi:signal recognition particle subunit SRP68
MSRTASACRELNACLIRLTWIHSLQLLLLEAERAWAYSQELITSALQPANDDKASSLRHSATGRFRRAVNWSTQLLSLCQSLHASSRLSVDSLLQVTVYTLILNGRFLRYRDEYEDALLQLSVARNLLDELADRAGTSWDQALATLFADDIGAEIRYCAHELGRSKAYDIDGIVKELASKHKNQIVEGCDALVDQLKKEGENSGKKEVRKKLDALVWEGHPIPVRNPELVDVMLKVQDAEARLEGEKAPERKAADSKEKRNEKGNRSKKGVAAYDAVLLALSDAEDVARKLVEAQQVLYLVPMCDVLTHMLYSSCVVPAQQLQQQARVTSNLSMYTLSTNCFPAEFNETFS